MHLLLLQAEVLQTDYAQWGIAGAIIFLVVACFVFLLRAMPTWKDVRLAEIKTRQDEAAAHVAQATSFGQLSEALKSMSETVNHVAVEQRQATEDVRHSQRVNADMTARTQDAINQMAETLDTAVKVVYERMDAIESLIGGKQ